MKKLTKQALTLSLAGVFAFATPLTTLASTLDEVSSETVPEEETADVESNANDAENSYEVTVSDEEEASATEVLDSEAVSDESDGSDVAVSDESGVSDETVVDEELISDTDILEDESEDLSEENAITEESADETVTAADKLLAPPSGSAPGGTPGESGGTSGGTPGGSGGGSSSDSISWTGATEITSDTTTASQSYSSTTSGQNALLAKGGGSGSAINVTLENPTVTKTGDGDASDNSSFYGINSAILAKSNAQLTIKGGTVETSAPGANGVFSYGGYATTNNTSTDGTTVNISDTKITTTGNGSGGIMTTGGGTTNASNLTIKTSGGSSAAIRSDRGGGTVNVEGGTYATSGSGSPAIYATATIKVSDATLTATGSQGIVNEGGNKVTLEDCTVNASNSNSTPGSQDYFYNGIFLYQSMSGDATDGASVFNMTGGTINNQTGHVIHVTKTSAAIALDGVSINNTDDENVFLSVCSDAWSGSNSNAATLSATNQTIPGKILVGSDSSAVIKLVNSKWNGSTSGDITAHRSGVGTISTSIGEVKVSLDEDSVWTLTDNSTVASISGEGSVNYGSYTLTVNGTTYSASNPYSGIGSGTDSGNSGSDDTNTNTDNDDTNAGNDDSNDDGEDDTTDNEDNNGDDENAGDDVDGEDEEIYVTEISLNKTSASVVKNKTLQLSATVEPSDATDSSVTWESSNSSIATVSQSGLVTAKAKGSATITATANDRSGESAACKITVTVPVTKVALDKTKASVAANKTLQLKATVSPSDATNSKVAWTSSNKSVATVSASGLVSPKAAGTTTITVMTKDGSKTAKCTVTVTRLANTLTISSPKNSTKTYSLAAVKKAAKSFKISAKSKAGKITYAATNAAKKAGVSVNSAGKVTVKKGTAKGSYKITVKAAQTAKYRSLSKAVKVVVK
ncbi:MAG: Ig-like domain-containing protein [Lachnospiraceae bacterium]|nr:Ig-like domain-containing protein [Lachnospiraceae bacterium]